MDGRASAAILIAENEPRTFASVGAALAHARTLQPGRRVGIAAGAEPEAPRVAAGLQAAAEPGQVLVTDAARWAEADGDAFRDAGPLAGPAGPVHAWELLWAEPAPRTRIRLCGGLTLEIDGERRDAPGGQAGTAARLPRREPGARAPSAASSSRCCGRIAPRASRRRRCGRSSPACAARSARTRSRGASACACGSPSRSGPTWAPPRRPSPPRAPPRGPSSGAPRARTPGRRTASCAPASCRASTTSGPRARRLETEELELEALEWIARASLGLGPAERGDAERAGRELVARSPFRETGHRFLMEALAGAGNIAEALRVYDDLRVLLRDELGTAPAPELQALHQRLLAGEGAQREIAGEPPAVALPRRLAPRERSAFVARDRELGLLREAWGRPAAGRRRVVMLAGDPGIGKTRLAREFADLAQADGAVLYAACQEEVLVAYQPFVEALRGAGLDWERIAAMPGAGELARVIPELPAAPAAGRGGCRAAALPALRGDLGAAGRHRRPHARSRSCSTTCTGPTAARCTCCGTSPAHRATPRCWSSARSATRRSARRIRSPSCWPTCAATGSSSASRSRASARATSAR